MVSRHEDVTQSFSSEGRSSESWLEEAISRDPALDHVLPQIRRLAASDAPVLIVGEPGSGRELAARAIHNLSGRAAHPFVLLDCASLSEPLIEAEMLGVDGATGGKQPHKMGLFEQAGQGTALLGEVGELPPRLQEALLRLLERHELVRLKSETPITVPARCLASTSVDLRSRVAAGLFRDDLHSRLATEILSLPPLRERAEDIPTLARHYLAQLGLGPRDLAPETEATLRSYAWPGNLRELREVIEQAALRGHGDRITPEDLPERLRTAPEKGPLPSLRDVEMRHIERVLQEARGNQRRASRILGISRWSLSRRLRKYGMQARGEE
ncbi:MAG TPA: sigma 54-interacting transcriptional regulator [Candidatus Binatia bacterium]|jgi:two-component system response regulator HydG|nr:sigma 54-interacting transcriptional regulator [Candidatus Binatia bacterium]